MRKVQKTKAILAALSVSAAIWRIWKMTNTAMNCVKAIGLGVAAGITAGVICKCAANRRRTLKYRAKHAANVMEDILENVVYMFK